MKWVIQDNIFSEASIEELVRILKRMEIDYEFVKVVPFTNGTLILNPTIYGSTMVIGSGTLNKWAVRNKINPTPFWNDDFNYEKCIEVFGDIMLNADAMIMPHDQVKYHVDPDREYFIRPSDDGKCFAGTIMIGSEIDAWFSRLNKYEGIDLSGFEKVMVCTTKIIHEETRVIVMGGKVVTASIYKRGDWVQYSADVDQDVLDFAQSLADIWTPAWACTMDIAKTPNGLKLIEINNFNSAGWYACNVQKIVETLEDKYT